MGEMSREVKGGTVALVGVNAGTEAGSLVGRGAGEATGQAVRSGAGKITGEISTRVGETREALQKAATRAAGSVEITTLEGERVFTPKGSPAHEAHLAREAQQAAQRAAREAAAQATKEAEQRLVQRYGERAARIAGKEALSSGADEAAQELAKKAAKEAAEKRIAEALARRAAGAGATAATTVAEGAAAVVAPEATVATRAASGVLRWLGPVGAVVSGVIEFAQDKNHARGACAGVGTAVGVLAGAEAGVLVGAAIGTAILPVGGTAVGSFVGGVIGAFAGSKLGKDLGHWVYNKFTGTPEASAAAPTDQAATTAETTTTTTSTSETGANPEADPAASTPHRPAVSLIPYSEEVKDIQKRMLALDRQLGEDTVMDAYRNKYGNKFDESTAADGKLGDATKTAIRRFQERLGLSQTGVADAAFIEALSDPTVADRLSQQAASLATVEPLRPALSSTSLALASTDQISEVAINVADAIKHGHSPLPLMNEMAKSFNAVSLNSVAEQLRGEYSLVEQMARQNKIPAKDVAQAVTLLNGNRYDEKAVEVAVELYRRLRGHTSGGERKEMLKFIEDAYGADGDMGPTAAVFADLLRGEWSKKYEKDYGQIVSDAERRAFLGYRLRDHEILKEPELLAYGLSVPTKPKSTFAEIGGGRS